MRKKRNKWVSASDVGRAAYCPHFLYHKYRDAEVSQFSIEAREKGIIKHEEFNQLAKDTRCYIASHLYGINHPNTELLRKYRDNTLKKLWLGEFVLEIYYFSSPTVIALARRFKLIDNLLAKTVDSICQRIRSGESNND